MAWVCQESTGDCSGVCVRTDASGTRMDTHIGLYLYTSLDFGHGKALHLLWGGSQHMAARRDN